VQPSRRSHQRDRGITRYGIFGLEVESRVPIEASPVPSTDGHRRVSLEEVAAPALTELWRSRDARSIVDRRTPHGRRVMSIESHPRLGYRIATPGHGRYVVSGDGTRIRAELPRSPGWRWQRLLFAQALPLAASLHGLVLFHASAVAIGGRAVAFVAASGNLGSLRCSRRSLLYFIGGGIAENGGVFLLLLALGFGEVSVVVPLAGSAPLFVLLLAYLFPSVKSALGWRIVAGVVLIVLGVALLSR